MSQRLLLPLGGPAAASRPCRARLDPRLHLFAVQLVLEVYLEVADRQVRPGRVQLAYAVVAADAGEVEERDARRDCCARSRERYGLLVLVEGAIAHYALEGVVGVGLLQVLEGFV